MDNDTKSFPSISTPCEEKSFEDFSDIQPITSKTASPPLFSNIVLKTIHNSEINLEVLFNIIPVYKISPKDIKRATEPDPKITHDKETICERPLMNIEDFNEMFISIRKYPKARGYRLPCKIKSFLDADFFFMSRNFHMKISKDKIAIIGGGSLETSEKLIKNIYKHFIDINTMWLSLNELTRQQINEVSEKFVDQEEPEDPEELRFYRILEHIIDRDEENVMERLRDINPIIGTPLYKTTPVFTSLLNCNAVFDYRLPEEICLFDKSLLLDKLGYDVLYHNYLIVKCMKATWTVTDPNDHTKILKKFSFSIQNAGTIKQNSSHNQEDNIAMYEKLVTDLGFLPYKEGCEYTKKKKTASIEVVHMTPKCEELLKEYFISN